MSRALVILLLVVALPAPGPHGLLPGLLHAQERARPTFGVVAGPVQSRQHLERGDASELHSGFLVGAWAMVTTPVPWLGVTAEVAVARRGGEYPEGPDQPTSVVDADYLALAILPEARLRLGPVALTAYAGPALDVHLHSQTAIPLQSVFQEPVTQVFAGVAGVGVELSRGRATFRGEIRVHEQLSSAYAGPVDGLRHRSTEAVFRVGMRPRPQG